MSSTEQIASVKTGILHKPIFHILLIFILGLLAYSNTFNVPFHFDDASNIVENYKLRDLNNFWPPSGSRWFGFLTFALNYHYGGLNTIGYHIVNLAIHILNAILVYWFVVFTFRTPYFSIQQSAISSQDNIDPYSPIHPFTPFRNESLMGGTYLPLFIALLFVSHPIQTQAVTYIVQRFTSLAVLFYLLSLVMYTRWRLTPSLTLPPRWGGMGGGDNSELRTHRLKPVAKRYTLYAVSLISAVLAMKTKEISFTLPVVIALYEFMFFEGKVKKRIVFLIPLLLTMLIIPLSLIDTDKPVGDVIGELREATQDTAEIPRWSYLFTQFRVIVTYIRLLSLPINQNLDYDYPIYSSFIDPNVFLSFLFLLSIFVLGVYLFYRSRYNPTPPPFANPPLPPFAKGGMGGFPGFRLISFGIFWFFITLSVESSIIPIRDIIFEHRVYLTSVGIIIVFTSSVFYVLQVTIHSSRFTAHASRIPLTTVYLLLSTVVLALSIATYQRNIVWRSKVTLWKDVVNKSPLKARTHNWLGLAYKEQGFYDNAIQEFQTAIKLKQNDAHAHNNLGLVYAKQGRYDNALREYQLAIELRPDDVNAHNNLGILYAKQGRHEDAIKELQTVIRLKPYDADAYNNLGVVYEKQGRYENAVHEFHIALKIYPDDADIHYNLGKVYEKQSRYEDAIMEFRAAIKLNPNYTVAIRSLEKHYKPNGDP